MDNVIGWNSAINKQANKLASDIKKEKKEHKMSKKKSVKKAKKRRGRPPGSKNKKSVVKLRDINKRHQHYSFRLPAIVSKRGRPAKSENLLANVNLLAKQLELALKMAIANLNSMVK